MKKLLILLLMSALLLSGCITEEDLAAEWEAGYDQGKVDGYDIGYNAGEEYGYDTGYEKGFAARIAQAQQEEETESSTVSTGSEEILVYVTDSGSKYHRAGCGSLWNSSHERTLSQAIASGYGPCGNCNPPVG